MKKLLAPFFTLLLLMSCSKEKSNLSITGNIEGLKKGTIYLQKVEDSKFVNVDSVLIDGDSHFTLHTYIESPEVLYLLLEKDDGIEENDKLEFFAEPGEMSINTTRNYFLAEAKVEGSESQKILEEYKKMISRFSDLHLTYLEQSLNASKDGDSSTFDSLQQLSDKNMGRRYLYTLNFIINNKDSYVAPYLALTETYNAKLKYLDSIDKILAEDVANSTYGKEFTKYVEDLKKQADSLK